MRSSTSCFSVVEEPVEQQADVDAVKADEITLEDVAAPVVAEDVVEVAEITTEDTAAPVVAEEEKKEDPGCKLYVGNLSFGTCTVFCSFYLFSQLPFLLNESIKSMKHPR